MEAEENGALRPWDAGALQSAGLLGRVPLGEAACYVGVLDWRRAKMGLWGRVLGVAWEAAEALGGRLSGGGVGEGV